MNTISELCERMWELEGKHGLLELEINGVLVWQYMRMKIYYDIAEKTKVLEEAHAHKQTIVGTIKKIYSYSRGVLLFNPFIGCKNIIDEIIIDHPRSKLLGNKNIDIYTYYYLKKIESTRKTYIVLERPFFNECHIKTDKKNRKYLDIFILIGKIYSVFNPARITNREYAVLDMIEDAVNLEFNINTDLRNQMINGIGQFHINYKLYKKLFSTVKPRKLSVLVGYAYGDAIKAAKDLGIETVEIQHGTFSKYHLGYSFPGRVKDLDYFPDKFMAWGEYWKKLNVIPLSEKNIIISGFTHFNNLRERYTDVVRNPRQILILSQGALGPQIADNILEQIESLISYPIVYKLHPGEYSRWQEYTSLVKLSKYPNVSIVKDEDLYRLFAESAFQIGVFSTALYEGLGFDCRTILLELPGIEYMRDLIETETVETLKKNESILNVIENYSQKKEEYHCCHADFFGDTSQVILT